MQMLLSKINKPEYFISYPAQRFPTKLKYHFSRNFKPDTIRMILAGLQRLFHVICLYFLQNLVLRGKITNIFVN